MQKLFYTLNRAHKIFTYSLITLVVVFVGAGFLYHYARIPKFLFEIEEGLEQNAGLMHLVGEKRGSALIYSPEELREGDSAKFSVQITGACDSAYLLVRGTYRKQEQEWVHRVQDTLVIKKCQ